MSVFMLCTCVISFFKKKHLVQRKRKNKWLISLLSVIFYSLDTCRFSWKINDSTYVLTTKNISFHLPLITQSCTVMLWGYILIVIYTSFIVTWKSFLWEIHSNYREVSQRHKDPPWIECRLPIGWSLRLSELNISIHVLSFLTVNALWPSPYVSATIIFPSWWNVQWKSESK